MVTSTREQVDERIKEREEDLKARHEREKQEHFELLEQKKREAAWQKEWEAQQQKQKSSTDRIAQGMRNVGSGAGKAATAVGKTVAQEAVAKPAKGLIGSLTNFWPENIFGVFIWGAALLYLIDWRTGFNTAATAELHIWFGVSMFFVVGFLGRYLDWWVFGSAIAMLYSLVAFFNFSLGTPIIQGAGFFTSGLLGERAFAIVGLAIALFLHSRSKAPGFMKLIPIVIFVDVWALPYLRELVFTFFGGWAGSAPSFASIVPFAIAFIGNRVLFPIWLWFGILSFSTTTPPSTRVAKNLLIVGLVFYLVAALPVLETQATRYYSMKTSSLTPEEKEVYHGVWERFKVNMAGIVSGRFLNKPIDNALQRAQRTFGFGEPEPEPKIGLQLAVPSEQTFNLDLGNRITPRVTMSLVNPLPPESEQRAIKVIDIKCTDISGNAVEPEGELVEPEKPSSENAITVGLSQKPARCAFEGEGSKEGTAYTAKVEVVYSVSESAYLSTTFMRADKIDALVEKGLDPAREANIAPAVARYSNMPVAITFSETFASVPVGLNIDRETKFSMIVYIGKSAGWNGKIYGINNLELIVPEGVTLDETGENCAFKLKEGERNTYNVKEEKIKTEKKVIFVGAGGQFECGLTVKKANDVLKGSDTMPTQFKVDGSFNFGTEAIVNYVVLGTPKPIEPMQKKQEAPALPPREGVTI